MCPSLSKTLLSGSQGAARQSLRKAISQSRSQNSACEEYSLRHFLQVHPVWELGEPGHIRSSPCIKGKGQRTDQKDVAFKPQFRDRLHSLSLVKPKMTAHLRSQGKPTTQGHEHREMVQHSHVLWESVLIMGLVLICTHRTPPHSCW